jgi:hypothetical protein
MIMVVLVVLLVGVVMALATVIVLRSATMMVLANRDLERPAPAARMTAHALPMFATLRLVLTVFAARLLLVLARIQGGVI